VNWPFRTLENSSLSVYDRTRIFNLGYSIKIGIQVNKAIFKRVLNHTCKWVSFSIWLPWFFVTLPWQLKKGYSQFISATTFTPNPGKEPVKYSVSRTYYDNLN
jgi:hypothetical protein